MSSSVAVIKAGQTAIITATFSEVPSGFSVSDFVSAVGDFNGFTSINSTHYSVVFTPTAGSSATDSAITIAAGSYTNAAGNLGGAGTAPTLTMDMLAPSIVITDDTAAVGTSPVTYTFTLSEPSSTFSVADITISGGTAPTSFASGISGDSVYTLVVTPTANSTTDMTVDVAANTFQDAAGNDNTVAAQNVQGIDTSVIIYSGTSSSPTFGTVTATFITSFTGTFSLYTAADGVTLYNGIAATAINDTTSGSVTAQSNATAPSTAYAIVKDSSGAIVGNTHSIIFGSDAADATLTGTAASDIIFGFAGANGINAGGGDNIIIGGDAVDTINAGNGNDTIIGGNGVNTINSGVGNDTITSGAGADVLTGGDGFDVMTGGAGADKFIFASIDADSAQGMVTDIIIDFGNAADNIKGSWGTGTGHYLEANASEIDVAALLSAADTQLNGIVKYYVGQVGSDSYLVTDDDGIGYTEVIKLTGVALNDAIMVVGSIVA